MKILLLLLALFTTSPLFAATGKLRAIVTDKETHALIDGANVFDINSQFGGSTFEGEVIIVGIQPGVYAIEVSHVNYHTQRIEGVEIRSDLTTELKVEMVPRAIIQEEAEVKIVAPSVQMDMTSKAVTIDEFVPFFSACGSRDAMVSTNFGKKKPPPPGYDPVPPDWNTEEYHRIYENEFLEVTKNPLSTFSIDVDQASYANARRFLTGSQLPPPDAVRIEEFINYFDYDYPDPDGKHPFSITTELGDCPWTPDHQLLHVGLQGKRMKADKLPPSSLTFLIDVSGSMRPPNKLPLLLSAFRMMVEQLRPEDRVAIVVYAGATGLVLPSTKGDRKPDILAALDKLQAGGTTAGGAGMVLAYQTAKDNFLKKGNNRVIWATDGDFNTGVSSTSEMVRMMEENRKSGIFLTMLGFGEDNLKDSRMEQMADKGNGQYFYIDNITEARKVMVEQIGGTLVTIAKDVKIQIEFNPAKVAAYRLIGYENRMLKAEDFHDDTKDAGEIGAGHSVTAIYELIPFGVEADLPKVDDLKYQSSGVDPKAFKTDEILTLKLRYKDPDADVSKLLEQPLTGNPAKFAKTSDNFRFSASAAAFGMLLRDSRFKGGADFADVQKWAKGALGRDAGGYRAEFIRLVEMAEMLKKPVPTEPPIIIED